MIRTVRTGKDIKKVIKDVVGCAVVRIPVFDLVQGGRLGVYNGLCQFNIHVGLFACIFNRVWRSSIVDEENFGGCSLGHVRGSSRIELIEVFLGVNIVGGLKYAQLIVGAGGEIRVRNSVESLDTLRGNNGVTVASDICMVLVNVN